jgi:hypothetical protein
MCFSINFTYTFTLKLSNSSGIPIFNFKVIVSTSGQLEPLSSSQSSTNIKSIGIQETVDLKFDFYMRSFDANLLSVEIILQDPEERSLDSLYSINCLPYSIGFTQLLVPISYNISEFEEEWNKAPAYFAIKTEIQDTLQNLLKILETHRFNKIFEWKYHSNYFQIAFAAVSLFNDKILLKITGKMSNILLCTFEFHGESHTLSAIDTIKQMWIKELFGESVNLAN